MFNNVLSHTLFKLVGVSIP